MLATAHIHLHARNGTPIQFRALIDPGSSTNLITEHAVQLIQAQKHRSEVTLATVGNNQAMRTRHKVQCKFASSHSEFHLQIEAIVISKITDIDSTSTSLMASWDHLHGLQLADPHYYKPGKIDVLIGVETYSEIILEGLIKGPALTPIAQHTHLGWILSGGYSDESIKKCFLTTLYSEDALGSGQIRNQGYSQPQR